MKFKDRKILECVQEQDLIIKKRTIHKNGDITIKYGKETQAYKSQPNKAPDWFVAFEKKNDTRWKRQEISNNNVEQNINEIKNCPTIKNELK